MISRSSDVERAGIGTSIKYLILAMRPKQWVKNAFVVAPLFFTPALVSPLSVLQVAGGVICFCALSSAVYVLNDYLDRESVRLHKTKRHRLIERFGSLAGVKSASPQEVAALPGFSLRLAERILEHLRQHA